MEKIEFARIELATRLAIDRVLEKGADDVFRPPTFSQSIETSILMKVPDEFRLAATKQTIAFLKSADLRKERVGPVWRGLVTKDQNSFRQCAWLDPFDAVKYLAVAYLLFQKIEQARIHRDDKTVHSHRLDESERQIFHPDFGYDSFRSRSAELSQERIGKWKVVTDIANFFDRIGNHSLKNHLSNIGCDAKYFNLASQILFQWAGVTGEALAFLSVRMRAVSFRKQSY